MLETPGDGSVRWKRPLARAQLRHFLTENLEDFTALTNGRMEHFFPLPGRLQQKALRLINPHSSLYSRFRSETS